MNGGSDGRNVRMGSGMRGSRSSNCSRSVRLDRRLNHRRIRSKTLSARGASAVRMGMGMGMRVGMRVGMGMRMRMGMGMRARLGMKLSMRGLNLILDKRCSGGRLGIDRHMCRSVDERSRIGGSC